MNVDYKQLLYQLRACNAHVQKAKTLGGVVCYLCAPNSQNNGAQHMLTLFMHTYYSRNYSGIIYIPLAVTLTFCCSSMVD